MYSVRSMYQRVSTTTELEPILQLYLKYCKNGGIISHKNG